MALNRNITRIRRKNIRLRDYYRVIMEDLGVDPTTFTQRLTTAEAAITALTDRVDDAEDAAEALTGRMDVVEAAAAFALVATGATVALNPVIGTVNAVDVAAFESITFFQPNRTLVYDADGTLGVYTGMADETHVNITTLTAVGGA